MSRILIAGGGTGGHLMPALALAEAIRRARPEVEPVLVGAARGVDASLLPTRGFRYYLLPFEPLYRRAWWRNLRWPLIVGGLLRAGAKVLADEQPAVVIGTGGYASGPILLQASWRGIPLVLQEQNAYPGVATRWLARRAAQLHLGFPEALAHVHPGARTAVFHHGNPITPPPEPRPDRRDASRRLGLVPERPVLLVMGGSQGARSINAAVATALEAGLLADVQLLWSTGAGMWERCRVFDQPGHCIVRPFWDPIAEAYAAADLVVCRAGAASTAELCAWELPAVLIPLPSAAGGHQARNAGALAAAGAAIHLPESSLTAEALVTVVSGLLADPLRLAAMARSAGGRGHPKAAETIAKQILTLVS